MQAKFAPVQPNCSALDCWTCSHCKEVNRFSSFCCSHCNKVSKETREEWESQLSPQMRVDVMDCNNTWFGGVITDCRDSVVTILFEGWSSEFTQSISKHSNRIAPYHAHTGSEDRNALSCLHASMEVFIRSGIGVANTWRRVWVESIDANQRICSLKDKSILLEDYPLDLVSLILPPNACFDSL